MLERLNSLEEKLESLLKCFIRLKKERDELEEESRKMRSQIGKFKKEKPGASKAGDHDINLRKEHKTLVERLRKSEEENKLLKKKTVFLEKELENKTALEEETMGKLRDIITRIDALEAEIGELEHEQIDPDND